MRHLRILRILRILLILLASVVVGASAARSAEAPVAARVGDETVPVADLDRRCGEKCAALRAAISERENATLAALIDEALLASAPAPTPATTAVSAAEIERYLAEHAADFHGPRERDRAAVRFFLERERRDERDRRLIAAARTRTAPPRTAPREGGGGQPDDVPDDVLARVGDRAIQRRDVEQRAALALYRLRGELARERLRRLDELIAERLWAAAALQRGVTADALRARVQAAVPPVGDDEIDRYFASELRVRDPAATKNPERIRPYLEFRARHAAEQSLVAAERARVGVAVLLEEPPAPRFALEPGPGGWRGSPAPGAHVLLLTSYRGEASRRTWQLVAELRARDGVVIGVRPLLPQWDPEATAVAAAARCAAAQGRFWEMQDALASADPLPDAAAVARIARSLGLDEQALAACTASAATLAGIAADSAAAERLGIVTPPVVLVEGQVLGAPSRERVEEALVTSDVAARPGPSPSPDASPLSAPSSSASASP